MDKDALHMKGYLDELYRQTGGDTEQQVSMYDLGVAIGLDKAEAGSIAEQLMVQGQAELRTLAGGISITTEGLAVLGISAPPTNKSGESLHLGAGPVADDADRRTVHLLTEEIKETLSGQAVKYDLLEEITLDLKTIEVHLLSPRPKIAVLREIFRSLHDALTTIGAGKIVARLASILS